MQKGKFLLKCCALILGCIMLGGVLITAANYLPINQANKAQTMEIISKEASFISIPSLSGEDGSFHAMEPTALELATDALMLRMALYEGENEGIHQAFLCYSTQPEYQSEYSRYWHGYVVVLRTLLMLFDYHEIRILNAFCQSVIVAMVAFFIWQRKGWKYALAIGTTYLLLMPMALGYCLQYTWIFYASFVPLLIYVKHKEFWDKENRYLYYFIVVGAVTTYLDLLTYPLLSWGLLIIWWIVLNDKNQKAFDYLKQVVFSGIAWIVGYGSMWMGKWALGSVILRQNLFTKAIAEARLWTVNEGEAAITLQDRIDALFINWDMYDYKIYVLVLIVWLLYWMIHSIIFGCNKNTKAAAMLLVFCSSFVWFTFLAGHALMHHIFTHRIYSVSIAAFLGMVLISTENKSAKLANWKHMITSAAVVGVLGVVSFFLMFLIKDEFSHHNGTASFMQVELDTPAYMTFTPSYSNVTKFTVGFSVVEGMEGECRLKLMDEGVVVEELVFPIIDYATGNFHETVVDWNLQAGYPYSLVIEPVDTKGQILLWVINDGANPLPEYGEVTIGDETYSGQMLAGISYWCSFTENSRRLLFAGAYMVIFMMTVYVGYNMYHQMKRDCEK